MADQKKISQLSNAAPLADLDYLPIVQSGFTLKATFAQISTYINGKLPANSAAFNGLSGVADRLAYFTGPGALALGVLTPFARTILDDANAAAAQTTLGIPALITAANRSYTGGVTNVAANRTILSTDKGKAFRITAASTMTLPIAGNTAGDSFIFRNESAGNVVLDSQTGNLIYSDTGAQAQTLTLGPSEWVEIQSNFPSWVVNARGLLGKAAKSGANTDITSITGTAAALTTPRAIGMTGDGTYSVSFNGAADVASTFTLANTGVAAGTYGSVTVDAKGRATAGTTVTPVANGGTGRNTTALYLADLVTAGAYSKTSILGTVSQASGVPTGAVIERGSNANGEYVKFADGTLIQTRTSTESVAITSAYGAVFQGPAATWTFPIPFVGNVPTVTCTPYGAGRLTNAVHNAAPSLTVANFALIELNGTSVTQSYTIRYLAVGRWF